MAMGLGDKTDADAALEGLLGMVGGLGGPFVIIVSLLFGDFYLFLICAVAFILCMGGTSSRRRKKRGRR